MELIINSIINQAKDVLPELQTIDEDYGQLENLDNDSQDMYPLTFPALLIDTPQTEWTNVSGKSQKGTVQVRTKLCIDCYDDTHYGSAPESKIEERAELVNTLHQSLQCFRPVSGGELIRTASRFYTYNHGIKVYETTYTLAVTDSIKETETVAAPSTVRVSVSRL